MILFYPRGLFPRVSLFQKVLLLTYYSYFGYLFGVFGFDPLGLADWGLILLNLDYGSVYFAD